MPQVSSRVEAASNTTLASGIGNTFQHSPPRDHTRRNTLRRETRAAYQVVSVRDSEPKPPLQKAYRYRRLVSGTTSCQVNPTTTRTDHAQNAQTNRTRIQVQEPHSRVQTGDSRSENHPQRLVPHLVSDDLENAFAQVRCLIVSVSNMFMLIPRRRMSRQHRLARLSAHRNVIALRSRADRGWMLCFALMGVLLCRDQQRMVWIAGSIATMRREVIAFAIYMVHDTDGAMTQTMLELGLTGEKRIRSQRVRWHCGPCRHPT